MRICLHVILKHLCMRFLGLLERAVRGGGAGSRNSSSVNQSKQIELKAVLSGTAELLWWYIYLTQLGAGFQFPMHVKVC